MKVCMSCLEVYKNIESLKAKDYDYEFCPKSQCLGRIVEIDDLMIGTIIELNKKGYSTNYCCSAHEFENCPSIYVQFENFNNESYDAMFDNFPNGFSVEIEGCDHPFVIRKNLLYSDNIYEDILNHNKTLRRWAKSLPNILEDKNGK